jgi:hypothetical protein
MIRIADPSFRLRDHHPPPSLPAAPALAPDLEKAHEPTLELADYIHPELATPPPAVARDEPADRAPGAERRDVARVAVDAGNLTECRIAIDEFAALEIGIALPATARGQTDWRVVGDGKTGNSAPGSWGAHRVVYGEYDPETFGCSTWGTELLVTVPFHQDYAREAHVKVSQEMLSWRGIGSSGVNWDELIADIKAL